jgi:hypothetical protein
VRNTKNKQVNYIHAVKKKEVSSNKYPNCINSGSFVVVIRGSTRCNEYIDMQEEVFWSRYFTTL